MNEDLHYERKLYMRTRYKIICMYRNVYMFSQHCFLSLLAQCWHLCFLLIRWNSYSSFRIGMCCILVTFFQIFTAALFVIAQNWKQPKSLWTTNGWTSCNTPILWNYSRITKNELLIQTTWINLKKTVC